jgi:hypothetical protein
MARDVFQMTIADPDNAANDELLAMEGVQVSVFARATTNPVSIYQRPTGATQGPTPETGATGGPNPFATGPTGDVEFWCDAPAELDVFIHDTIVPARVPDRTYGWNAFPAAGQSVPSSIIRPDGGLGLGACGADITRQFVQIGQVIDWWRPADTVPLPSGFEVCDGHQVLAANHAFPGIAGNINVPDLRNMFILGATTDKADGSGAGGTDVAADAPGIRGVGGSHRVKLVAAESGVPAHAHPTNDPGHAHVTRVMTDGGQHYAYGTASPVAELALSYVSSDIKGTGVTVGNNGAQDAANSHSNLPRFVGLLKLIKVRWS